MPDSTSISRVHYFDRQFLRTQDFSDEQGYHLAMHRRHNIGGHIWGIVFGLEVVLDQAGNLGVLPGVAIDGFGRELILPYPQSINPRVFDEQGSERIEVWLEYARIESGPAASGYAACDSSAQPTRSQEIAQVILKPPDPNLVMDGNLDIPERRQPLEIAPSDLRFDPTRIPPDDPARVWPVFLGLIRRQKGQKPLYAIFQDGRPYAGLIGEWIKSPSGRAWVQIGAEFPKDPYRFAVYLPEVADPDRPGMTRLTDISAAFLPTQQSPRVGITSKGELNIRGDVNLEGGLTVNGGAVEFGVGLAAARPNAWNIYHVKARAVADKTNPTPPMLNQLRIEMAEKTTPKGTNQVVIGHFSAKEKKFVPCLTVDDRCIVTIHGNLFVEGKILQGANVNEAAPVALTAQAQSAATGMLMMSMSNTLASLNSQIGLMEGSGLGVPAAVMAAPNAASDSGPASISSLESSIQGTIQLLKRNPLLLNRTIDLFLEDPQTHDLFAARLASQPASVEAAVEGAPAESAGEAPVAPAAAATKPLTHPIPAAAESAAEGDNPSSPGEAENPPSSPPAQETPARRSRAKNNPGGNPPAEGG